MMATGEMATILVVEDDVEIRSLLHLQLELEGYQVLGATTGEEALDLLRARPVDLVLLDTGLPGMSGNDVLRAASGDLGIAQVPVIVLSGEVGVDDVVASFQLGAHDYVTKPFRAKELRARVAAALLVKRRHDQLRREIHVLGSESRTDSLTGLANRRKLESDMHVLISSARRHGQPFAVALVDVDHFKVVNDTFGHPAGDHVLRTIADRLSSTLRVEDVGGRWGGEEFLFLLPMTDMEGALVVGERLRSRVACEPVVLPSGLELDVRISVGVAAGTDADLLARADAALYRAKAAGRNLVTTA
jgi:diguanylate cyclase (GGDEF)-like protein